MKPIEIIVIVACAIIVIGVIIKAVIDIKKGKVGCGDCASCKNNCAYKNKIKEEVMEKYLKCSSCGATVKVIKDCNCLNCGIRCCGKEMEEYTPEKNEDLTEKAIISCESCGAKVAVIKECKCPNCGIQCCGKEMK